MGFSIMRAVVDDLQVTASSTGTVVRLAKRLSAERLTEGGRSGVVQREHAVQRVISRFAETGKGGSVRYRAGLPVRPSASGRR